MKHLSVILFFWLSFSLLMTGCDNSVDKGKTTNTLSSEFSTLEEKMLFLQRYFNPKRTYQKLDIAIVYHDNSTGGIPGPSDWDIRLVAIVPPIEIDLWISGLKKMPQTPDTKWLSRIPTNIDYSTINEWYDMGFSSVIGINRELGLVVYRNVTN